MVPPPPGYRTTARLFHWLTALGVLLMIPAGIVMTRQGIARPLQDALFLFHKNTGVILALLIAARILYRLAHPPPPLPVSIPGWQRRAAAASHALLYAALVVMPFSGFVRVRAEGYPIELLDRLGAGPWIGKSERIADAAQGIHAACALVLIAVLAVHIGAACHHALIRRDGVWSRMWPIRAGRRAV